MLVLTRKTGESVVLGNHIKVTVVELSPGTVRLGFEAPRDVSIYREEIYSEIAAMNQAAVDEEAFEGAEVRTFHLEQEEGDDADRE